MDISWKLNSVYHPKHTRTLRTHTHRVILYAVFSTASVFLTALLHLLAVYSVWWSYHLHIHFLCVLGGVRETEWVKEQPCEYLLVDILVVFNGWSFGVVTGGGWGGGKTPEQTTGVLLLSINELLHKTLPRVHNKQHVQANVINFNAWFQTGEIYILEDARITTAVQYIFKPSRCNQLQNVSLEVLAAAAAWQMGCRGGFLREQRTQLCTNQQLNDKIDYEVLCVGHSSALLLKAALR